ncbi:MAG: ubiquinol-cytochrome c reductase iron-sulfur subunit [Methylophaga sp.]|nr:ubiquinol-cytochrome c reductase iron-sulfur subunit [Methylophaga sp.]
MSNKTTNMDNTRRRFLVAAGTVVGGAGIAAALIPFVSSMSPSARAYSAGASVEVDVSKLEPGQQITVEWRSKPVWILRRTEQVVDDLQSDKLRQNLRDPDSLVTSQQPDYVQNAFRSRKEEFLVTIGICTHLGCIPTFRPDRAPEDLGPDWLGGYFCPCHGSRFDLAGRVFKNVPAPTNLVIPPYYFLSDNKILIGEDGGIDSTS